MNPCNFVFNIEKDMIGWLVVGFALLLSGSCSALILYNKHRRNNSRYGRMN